MRSKSRVPSKVKHYRPRLEKLESRLAPAGVFSTIANDLPGALTPIVNTLSHDLAQETASLPILGQSLAQRAADVQNAVNGIGTALNTALTNQAANATAITINSALSNAGVGSVQVDPSNFDPANGNVTITAHFRTNVPVTAPQQGFHFNLGLPGVPFSLSASTNLNVSIDIDYGTVSFGVHNGAFFFTPAGDSHLTATLNASTPDLSFDGKIGFFNVTGTPIAGVAPISLSAGLVMNANGNASLTGSANVDIHLDAHLGSGASFTFPHIETEFVMSWTLDSNSSNISSPGGLGLAPDVEFRGVQFGLGSFLGSMVQPIANLVDEITQPLAPVYDLMQTPLPGLSQLAQAAGLPPVTLDTLLSVAVNADVLPPDYQLLAELGLRLHTLVEIIRSTTFSTGGDALVPMGSFNLGGNGDLRTSALSDGQSYTDWLSDPTNLLNLTKLVPVAEAGTSSVESRINNLGLPSAIQDQVDQIFDQINQELRLADNGIGLTFPLLDDPLSAFKLLLGQDVDFVKFDATFNGHASETQTIPVWGPITAGFTGTIDISMNLHAGVDTYGLRQYFVGLIQGTNPQPSVLDQSFYVDPSEPLVTIKGGITADAGPKLTFGADGSDIYAEATFNGSVQTNKAGVSVSFVNSTTGDGKLRPIGLGGSLFNVSGKIDANLSFSVKAGLELAGHVIDEKTVFSIPLASKTLFNASASIATGNPLINPTPPPNSIDVIFDARVYDDDSSGQNVMYIQVVNGSLNFIYNGVIRATYALASVRSITVFGSDEATFFSVSGDFGGNLPLQINGGDNPNNLLFFDDQNYTSSSPLFYTAHGATVERDELFTLPGLGLAVPLPTTVINFSNMGYVDVNASLNSQDVLSAYNLFTQTSLVGGNLNNQFLLGGPNEPLDSVFNYLNLAGGQGLNKLIVSDESVTNRSTYTVLHDGLDWTRLTTFNSFSNGAQFYVSVKHQLYYRNINDVEIDAGGAGNTFTVDDIPSADDANPTGFDLELYTGTGADNVTVAATTGPLFIQGQGGNDVVTLGVAGRGTQDISSNVFVDNITSNGVRGNTTLNIDDAGDSNQRTVTFDTIGNTLGTIDGFVGDHSAGTTFIFYIIDDVPIINVQGSNAFNTFNVLNTPERPVQIGFGSRVFSSTHLTLGNFFSTVNVSGTTGPLTIIGGGELDAVYLGGDSTSPGELANLQGGVILAGGFSGVVIKDGADHGFRYYTMNADSFDAPVGGGIIYSDMTASTVDVSLANDGNQVTINGTPTTAGSAIGQFGVNFFTGNGSDVVQVNGSTSPLFINLGAGGFQNVSIGSNKASLDGIGDVDAFGSGTIGSFISDAAATTSQTFNLTTIPGAPNSQVVKRIRPTGDGSYTLNTFTFDFANDNELQLTAGKGGDEFDILGTPANTTTLIQSGAGQDSVNINTDILIPKTLGPVYFYGNAAQGDNASFVSYDSATPPQFYILQATASKPTTKPNVLDQQVVLLSGDAPITFKTIAALTVNMPNVGGNFVSIQGVPAGESLTVNDANDDQVIFGNAISSPIGLMTSIRGTTTINANTNTSVTLDDSIDSTGRHVVLQRANNDSGDDLITGMSPGDIYLGFGEGTLMFLRGGLGNDTFSLTQTGFYFYRIDGGMGTNTLDYSRLTTLESQYGVYVNLLSGEASGLFGITRIQNVIGSPFDDILVGNGGNVLDGGAGNDILIAGSKASTLIGGAGDDLLIGGTTAYDTNVAALDAVMAQWASNASYDDRAALVRGLLAGNVTSNGGGNTMLGQAGLDLFFGRSSDFADLEKLELFVDV